MANDRNSDLQSSGIKYKDHLRRAEVFSVLLCCKIIKAIIPQQGLFKSPCSSSRAIMHYRSVWGSALHRSIHTLTHLFTPTISWICLQAYILVHMHTHVISQVCPQHKHIHGFTYTLTWFLSVNPAYSVLAYNLWEQLTVTAMTSPIIRAMK